MKNYENCVYRFISPSNKSYIGITANFLMRVKTHKRNIEKNIKSKFYDACRKYGFENFEYEILKENIETRSEMNDLEIFYIKKYKTFGKNSNGYNLTKGGEGTQLFGSENGMFGKKHKDESKEKMSKNRIGKCLGNENAWSCENKTPEELMERSKKAINTKKLNFDKLTNEEKELVKEKRSKSIKNAWDNIDNNNFHKSLAALKYWENKTPEELKIINKKKANHDLNNARATKFILEKNNKKVEIFLRKNLYNFCINNFLVFNVINKYINKDVIPEPKKYDTKYNKDEFYTKCRNNTTGWKVTQTRIKK